MLGTLLLSAGYLAVVGFGLGTDMMSGGGMEWLAYGLLVAFFLMQLMFVSAITILVPLFVTDGKAKTVRVLNDYILGMIAASVMFPIHLVYGPTIDSGGLFAIDGLGELSLLTLVWFLALDVSRLVLMKLTRLDVAPAFALQAWQSDLQ